MHGEGEIVVLVLFLRFHHGVLRVGGEAQHILAGRWGDEVHRHVGRCPSIEGNDGEIVHGDAVQRNAEHAGRGRLAADVADLDLNRGGVSGFQARRAGKFCTRDAKIGETAHLEGDGKGLTGVAVVLKGHPNTVLSFGQPVPIHRFRRHAVGFDFVDDALLKQAIGIDRVFVDKIFHRVRALTRGVQEGDRDGQIVTRRRRGGLQGDR